MIAHNFIFLALYIILTVNFMNIESTSKVSPSYYTSEKFSPFFVNTVNALKTYNEREKNFSEKEITILTNPVQTYNDAKSRNKVFDKFNNKIEEIKCTCSLIVKTKLDNLTNILEGLQKGDPIDVAQEKLNVLKEEAGYMVLLFQKGNIKAGKWFWSFYLKIMAMIDYESNNNFFGETPFEIKELQSGITNFLKKCKENNYLPKNRTESDLVSKNSNVTMYMFRTLRSSTTISGHYVSVMQHISIDYLYLKPLWDEHKLLFGEITGSVVEWRPTIRRHAAEVNKTKKYIENRQWISNPFGCLSYHRLIKQIISVRMYTFLWVMLVIFNKEMPQMDQYQLKRLYIEAMQTINRAHRFMHYTETIYFDVVAEFHSAINEGQINFDSIVPRISVRVKEILVELNGSSSKESDYIRIDITKKFTHSMTLEFLEEFSDSFDQLKEKITIFNYELALSILVEGN